MQITLIDGLGWDLDEHGTGGLINGVARRCTCARATWTAPAGLTAW